MVIPALSEKLPKWHYLTPVNFPKNPLQDFKKHFVYGSYESMERLEVEGTTRNLMFAYFSILVKLWN